MDNNINVKSKKLSILNLNKRKSAAEISWDLFHEFKNLNNENIFTDFEIYKYPVFHFRFTIWLIHQNKCYNGLFTNNQEIIIPAEISDLIKIIGKRIKTHKENDEISVSFIPVIEFNKRNTDLKIKIDNDKSSSNSINSNILGLLTKGLLKDMNLAIDFAFLFLPKWYKVTAIALKEGIYAKNNAEDIFAAYCGCCQAIIDIADEKARTGVSLTEAELNNLLFIYKLISIGGYLKGYKEASALLNLYINPQKSSNYREEKPYIINSDVYKTSKIVQYAQDELKKIIETDFTKGILKEESIYDTKKLNPTNRKIDTEGNVQEKGNLIVEQNNQRLKNTDNRFYLKVKVLEIKNNDIELLWFVNSCWAFKSYESGANYFTELPYNKEKGQVLTIPDGLSNYLAKINKAKEFYYGTEWSETVCIKK